jgi:23S rRNA (guanine745-N1)-methyltransferase
VHWRCPHCSGSLGSISTGLACTNGHSFDRAREGYVNLMPSGRLKGRGVAGDSDEMIRARRAFFDAGHYLPIAQAVSEAVGSADVVLDAGCGEGFYVAQLRSPERWGIDISKPAIKLASRRYPDISFAVGSSFHLPVEDHSVDAVVSVFAPRPFEEFARVLKPGGFVVVASPGVDHLRGLTDLIYTEPQPHEQRPHTEEASVEVWYQLHLGQPDITHLVMMTPYWWKATAEQQEQIRNTPELTVTVDVVVSNHRNLDHAIAADRASAPGTPTDHG